MVKVGVCLAGCGVNDGSEVHESVITLLALDRAGVKVICFAPDRKQYHVVNHNTSGSMSEERNVLIESARISRGNILNIKNVSANDLDAIIFPGGFGAALNLCNFGLERENCTADPEVNRLILEMHAANKPIGAICIAPALIARVLGKKKIILTIGTDEETAEKIELMGAVHKVCKVNDIVVDQDNKIVSTPAYMLANRISEAAAGIEKLVNKIVELAS